MGKQAEFEQILDGSHLRVGVVRARWNGEVTESLSQAARTTLTECGVDTNQILETSVPGSFELPWKVQSLFTQEEPDVVIAIGCLIKGETPHFEYLSDATTHALMQISLNPQTPVVFGVLTCWNQEQAWARAQGADNLGISWAKTAIELGQT